jgi:uncharacterized membrane protein
MNDLFRAAAIGAVSGSRSMMGPTVIARQALPGGAAQLMPLLAFGEILADKHPRMPARTTFLPLAGRMMSGAFAGAAYGRGRHRITAAVAGAAGAVAAAFALYRVRRYAASRGVSNVVAGAVEDALVITAAALLARDARRAAILGSALPRRHRHRR